MRNLIMAKQNIFDQLFAAGQDTERTGSIMGDVLADLEKEFDLLGDV
jgi:hypothetical protein